MAGVGSNLNHLLNLDAAQARYREDGKWYHHLTAFPSVLIDKGGYVWFNSSEEYLLHPNLQLKQDLHVIGGISSMPTYIRFTIEQLSIISGGTYELTANLEETIRVKREVDIILRKPGIVKRLKALYDNTCQICGTRLQIKANVYYSEVHHIVPLGSPHNGKDHLSNIICVCPNHHVLLDFKAISIKLEELVMLKHSLSPQFIAYHNAMVVS